MIEYLFNNTIKETILAKALYEHSRTGPSITSWRDLIDILCIGSLFIILLYLFICRTGFSACDKLLIFFFTPVLTRLQQKVQQQSQQQEQQTQQQPPHQQKPSAIPTAPPSTISEQLNSLSIIAGRTQPNFNRHNH